MTRREMAAIIAFAESACRTKEPVAAPTAEAYFQLLGHLSADVGLAAMKTAILKHPYPDLPPASVVIDCARALQAPAISGPEAWKLALNAARNYSPDIAGDEQKQLAKLPPRVAHAVKCFGGLGIIVNSTICQNQFLDRYETLKERDTELALLPPSVQKIAGELAAGFGMEPKALEAAK